jgi:hypothetical protein
MDPKDAFNYLVSQIRETSADNLHRYVIPMDLAKPILNYQSIRHDLTVSKEAAIILMQPNLDQTIMSSLWHSIIILYGKCFVSSKNSVKLESSSCFSQGHTKLLKTHNDLMELRHTFVAHRGKTIHEFGLAYVKIDPARNQSEVKIEQLKQNRPTEDELTKYVLLFDHLIPIVEDKIIKVGSKVIVKLHATTTPEDLFKI